MGLTVTTLAFAILGPGLTGTMIIMTLLGIFSGFLFVPLNALLQWRSPEDRRGAIIAFANVLCHTADAAGLGAGPGAGQGRGSTPGARSWALPSCCSAAFSGR